MTILSTGCAMKGMTGGVLDSKKDSDGYKILIERRDLCLNLTPCDSRCLGITPYGVAVEFFKPQDVKMITQTFSDEHNVYYPLIQEIKVKSLEICKKQEVEEKAGKASYETNRFIEKKLMAEREEKFRKEQLMKEYKELEECSRSLACIQLYEAKLEGESKGKKLFEAKKREIESQLNK